MQKTTPDQQAALEKLVAQKRRLARLRMIMYLLAVVAIATASYIIGKNQVELQDALVRQDSVIAKKDSTITEIVKADSINVTDYPKDSIKEINPTVTIRYFSQQKEGDYIVKMLQNSGFKWEQAEGKSKVTNAIWQGEDVPDKAFEQVVLLLLKGGVQLQQIEKIHKSDKRNVIDIGYSQKSEDKPPFTVETFLKIKGKPLAY